MASFLIPEKFKHLYRILLFLEKLKERVVLKPVLVRWLNTSIQALSYG